MLPKAAKANEAGSGTGMNSIRTFEKSIPLFASPGVAEVPNRFEFAQNASMPTLAESNASVTVWLAVPNVPVICISVALTRVSVSEPVYVVFGANV
jgi:hypothetical protein